MLFIHSFAAHLNIGAFNNTSLNVAFADCKTEPEIDGVAIVAMYVNFTFVKEFTCIVLALLVRHFSHF